VQAYNGCLLAEPPAGSREIAPGQRVWEKHSFFVDVRQRGTVCDTQWAVIILGMVFVGRGCDVVCRT